MSPTQPPRARRIAGGGAPTIVEPRPLTPAGAPPDPATGLAADSPGQTGGPGLAGAPATGTLAQNGHAAAVAAIPGTPANALAPTGATIERMSIEGVWLAYGDRWVVRDVSLPVRQGEVLALIGASGSGKTTLLRSLNRLTEITDGATRAGRIALDGEEVETMEVNALRRRISMVFQQPNPFPMSIYENVAYALREEHAPGRRRRRRSRRELEPEVVAALRRAGLYEEVAGDLDHPALRLSGGQQQRLCIARGLAVRPEVLLLDEPCSALDPISTATIERLIVELRSDVAIVIVTHNLQQAMRVADHVAFMHLGELVEYGPSAQIFGAPRNQRTRDYVGGAFG
ncbi:MAG TPA: ATP-binding cassette domain-containing protein [Solirubrobacteraceae bacterium]|jgi:phosphate transport system ATP-binding protein